MVANRVEGGKRPRSSMAPTMVFDPDGALFAALGSPGGARIIGYVAQTLVGLIDWHLPMQAPSTCRGPPTETGRPNWRPVRRWKPPWKQFEAMGHEVTVQPMVSGLHGIRITNGRLDGGADRRREGVVIAVER
jgi:gamma-glutamyltranspeptidase / glutathione hydrolase